MEREIMDGIYQTLQTALARACLCALCAMAVPLFLAKVAAPLWDELRKWWTLPRIQRVLVGAFVVGLAYYGATKHAVHIGYDGGIKAGATANVVTNDTVSIHWQRDTSSGVIVPESATVYIDYRPNDDSNAVDWVSLAETTVGAWGWSGTVANATNYDYNVWAYYIPPEPVHTNGTWTYKTMRDNAGRYVLPLRATVAVNGRAISPPNRAEPPPPTAKSYVQDGLVAMWDGIENAGWGKHTADKNGLRELVSGAAFSLTEEDPTKTEVVVGDDCVDFNRLVATSVTGGVAEFDTDVPGLGAVMASNTVMTIELTCIPDLSYIQTYANQRWGLALNVGGSRLRRWWQGGTMCAGFNNQFYYEEAIGAYNSLATMKIWQTKRHTALVASVSSTTSAALDFIDGVQVAAKWRYFWPGVTTIPTDDVKFGLRWVSEAIAIPCRFYAWRVYSRALTAEEIAHNYEIDKARFGLP